MSIKCNRIMLIKYLLIPLISSTLLNNSTFGECNQIQERIVSIGGANTEIVYALGAGKDVIAVDTSSTFPNATQHLPKVGYHRALSAEPIVALRPTIIILGESAGPPEVISQLKKMNIPMVVTSSSQSILHMKNDVRAIAEALNRKVEALVIEANIDRQYHSLSEYISKVTKNQKITQERKPRVLFFIAVDQNEATVAGKKTAANRMIELAGGINAAAFFINYKNMNGESIASLSPDILLSTERVASKYRKQQNSKKGNTNESADYTAIMNLPALKLTPAAIQKKLIVMDDHYLLGFGPRVANAAMDLSQRIYESR